MTLYNCFHHDEVSIKLLMLKYNCLPYLFEIIEESHVNNINNLNKALETLKLILIFAFNSSDELWFILENQIKRSSLPSILEKLTLSNNQDISLLSTNIIDILN